VQELEYQNHLKLNSLGKYSKANQLILQAAAEVLQMPVESLLVAEANYRSALKHQNAIISLPNSDSQYHMNDKMIFEKATSHGHLSPLYYSKSQQPQNLHDSQTIFQLPTASQPDTTTYLRSDHYEPVISNQMNNFDFSGCQWNPALATSQHLTGRLSQQHAQNSTSWFTTPVTNESTTSMTSAAGTETDLWPALEPRQFAHPSTILQLSQVGVNHDMELQSRHYLEANVLNLNVSPPVDAQLRQRERLGRRDRGIQVHGCQEQRSSPSCHRSTTRRRHRGPYQNPEKKKETGLTRSIGACIQCQMQRIRVSLWNVQ
jgi:hypothetical protein